MLFTEIAFNNEDDSTVWTRQQLELLENLQSELWIRMHDARIPAKFTRKLVCCVFTTKTEEPFFEMDGVVILPVKDQIYQRAPASDKHVVKELKRLAKKVVTNLSKKDTLVNVNIARILEVIALTGDGYEKQLKLGAYDKTRTMYARMYLQFGQHGHKLVLKVKNRKKQLAEYLAVDWKDYNSFQSYPVEKLKWSGATINCLGKKGEIKFSVTPEFS